MISKILAMLLFVSLVLLITHTVIFRWKVQVASKGLYFRKPKASLIFSFRFFAVLSILGYVVIQSLCVTRMAVYIKHTLHALLRFCP